ncbi:MAG: 50S ribosomal protein L21 [Candidatus Daviesbacteria bacterium]
MNYAIVQIGGRQYLIKPNLPVEVDKLVEPGKKITVDKVLLLSQDNKVEVGKPYLKQSLEFEVLENVKKPKVRVATYKAKANYRKVKGQRREMSQIRLVETKKDVKKHS